MTLPVPLAAMLLISCQTSLNQVTLPSHINPYTTLFFPCMLFHAAQFEHQALLDKILNNSNSNTWKISLADMKPVSSVFSLVTTPSMSDSNFFPLIWRKKYT